MLWLRTRPRNVATAPSAPPPPTRWLTAATSGSSAAADRGPIARSGRLTIPVYRDLVLPEMIQGPVAAADGQTVANRAAHVRLRARHRIHESLSASEIRRDGGRKRAPGPVRVPGRNPRRLKLRERLAVEEQVDDLVAERVSSRDDDRRGAHLVDPHGRGPRVVDGFDGPAAQDFGFRNVRRHDHRARQQLQRHRAHPVLVQQTLAALGRASPDRRRPAAARAPRSPRRLLRRWPRSPACRSSWRESECRWRRPRSVP